jgi:hypothetical protein
MWGALSDKRTLLPFTITADPRQRSNSWIRVLWGFWPYFTISDSILPFSSPPTTRRVTVEVFNLTSTLIYNYYSSLCSLSTDLTENVSSIIACSLIGETCPQSRSQATVFVLSPSHTAVIWQWVYISEYSNVLIFTMAFRFRPNPQARWPPLFDCPRLFI